MIEGIESQVSENGTVLTCKVPEGVANSRPIKVRTSLGDEVTSKFLFRDRRNIFLDFDELQASDHSGSINTTTSDVLNWKDDYIGDSKIGRAHV